MQRLPQIRWACLFVVIVTVNQAIASNRITPLVRAIKQVRPSVVNIHSEKAAPVTGSLTGTVKNRLSGMGTGVIIDDRGYIVTNYHVIEDVSRIRVTLVDGATHTAEIIARDPEIDIALLKIEPLSDLEIMPLGKSSDLMYGETVVAIGNAYGYEHTITRGIISELNRDVRLSETQSYRNLIQTDASINPGNSGGPLINADGEMIGLNVAIRANAQGIGFAIPVDDLKRVLANLLSTRKINSLWHGIICNIASDKTESGVGIKEIEVDSPAAEAGLQAGDQLLSVDDANIKFAYDLERALLGKSLGDKVDVTIERDGIEQQLTFSMQSIDVAKLKPIDVVWHRLGMRLADNAGGTDVRRISTQLRGGLQIMDVREVSAARRAGFRTGDVLVGLHHWETLSVENVVYVLNKPDAGNPLRFFVIRGDQIHRGWLEIPAGE